MAIERAVTIAEQAVHSDMVLPDIFEPQLILDRGIQSYASLLDEQTLPVEAMARKRNAFCSGYLDTHQAEAIASPGVAALHVRTWRYLAGTAIIIGEDAGAQSNANEADAHFERAISVKGLVPHTDTLWLADYSSSKRFKQELEHILPDTTIAAMARHHQLVSAAKHQLALLYTETVEN
jgi:hypothetical protein